uniref:Secreted protein n=1 Tax=Romanomermis culicivorax TaxID=13658 RepID=A0A915JBB4_ROMCU
MPIFGLLLTRIFVVVVRGFSIRFMFLCDCLGEANQFLDGGVFCHDVAQRSTLRLSTSVVDQEKAAIHFDCVAVVGQIFTILRGNGPYIVTTMNDLDIEMILPLDLQLYKCSKM